MYSGRPQGVRLEEKKKAESFERLIRFVVPPSVSHGGVNEVPATSRLPSEDSRCGRATTSHILIFAFMSLTPVSPLQPNISRYFN